MTDAIELRLGTVVSSIHGVEKERVVVQVEPSVNTASIVRDEMGERIKSDFGTLSGPVEIIGSWALDKVVKTTAEAFNGLLSEDYISEYYQRQLEAGPVIYTP